MKPPVVFTSQGRLQGHAVRAMGLYGGAMALRQSMAVSVGSMEIFKGVSYNLKGLRLAIRTPRLLVLGSIRFACVLLVTLLAVGTVLYHYQALLNLMWTKPDSAWIVWVWTLLSWLFALFLIGMSAVVAYFVAQLLFAVVIMDMMSRFTEFHLTGAVTESPGHSYVSQLAFLVRQEIPRTVLPVLTMMVLMVLGWLTPLGPVVTVVSAAVTAVFLAWDHTDLVPARRLLPFRTRFGFLMKTIPFHLGFGILFLIPLLNAVFLSFAPVGATLYHIDRDR